MVLFLYLGHVFLLVIPVFVSLLTYSALLFFFRRRWEGGGGVRCASGKKKKKQKKRRASERRNGLPSAAVCVWIIRASYTNKRDTFPLFFPVFLYSTPTTNSSADCSSGGTPPPPVNRYASPPPPCPPTLGRMQFTLRARLAEHQAALRASCKQCLSGL